MTAILFTDIDPFVCAWLRDLIRKEHLAGDVLEADVRSLRVEDLRAYRRVHLFAGIGGWELALELAGWPDDLRVLTGSCPCQPFSVAGRRKGNEDERHLWPHMRRIVAELRPPVVFGEQVAGPLGRAWLAALRTDLERLGYAVGAADLPAAGVGAPHIRQRLWLGAVRLAHAERVGREWAARYDEGDRPADGRGVGSARVDGSRTATPGLRRWPAWTAGPAWLAGARWWSCVDRRARPFEPGVRPLADGFPGRVGMLRAAGNAIVPQVAAIFVEALMDAVAQTAIADTDMRASPRG